MIVISFAQSSAIASLSSKLKIFNCWLKLGTDSELRQFLCRPFLVSIVTRARKITNPQWAEQRRGQANATRK